jgi:hypothetical protein
MGISVLCVVRRRKTDKEIGAAVKDEKNEVETSKESSRVIRLLLPIFLFISLDGWSLVSNFCTMDPDSSVGQG